MYTIEPIGYVRTSRRDLEDDFWGATTSSIELTDLVGEDSLLEIESFSHAEIIFLFDQVEDSKIVHGARHPRNNLDWPKVGIFAQRGKNRPNRLGLTIVEIVGRQGRTLYVTRLDAIDGTPVIDIKPVMSEFLPNGPIRQPDWSHELMQSYWLPAQERPEEP